MNNSSEPSSSEQKSAEDRQRGTRRSTASLLVVVVLMFGFGYALVPLYDVLCDVFDLNGKPSNEVASLPTEIDTTRTLTVEFSTTLNSYLPWKFEAVEPVVTVHPGELKTVAFKVTNLTNRDMVGQAVPSVSPGRAAEHLHKTECFCFSQQVVPAGESRIMPLRFFVDTYLPKNVERLTLSYTFFDVTKQAAATDVSKDASAGQPL